MRTLATGARFWAACMVVVAAGALARAAYLAERRTWPDHDHPTMDARYHDDWARAVAFGEWEPRLKRQIREGPYFRAPLYPYALAATYRLGGSRFHARAAQAVLGCLTAVLLALSTRRLFSPLAGVVACALWLGYWPTAYFEGELLIAPLALFLDAALLGALLWAARRGALGGWALPGLVLGLSALARPNILVVLPGLALWLFSAPRRRGKMRRVLPVGIMIVACAACIAPVTIRNRVRGADLVFIASQGGVNFYIGNNPHANGAIAVVPGTRADWWGGYDDAYRLAEAGRGRKLAPSQVSRYWYEQGLRFLLQQPAAAARLYGRKLLLVLGNAEVSNNRPLYFARARSDVLPHLPVGFGLILSLTVVGVAFLRREGPGDVAEDHLRWLPAILCASYALSVVGFFVTSRHRLPAVLFMMPYAGWGVDRLATWARARQWQRLVVVGSLCALVYAVAALNPLGVGARAESRGNYELGVDYMNVDDPERALEAFSRSIAADSSYAPAWRMRGDAYKSLEAYALAEPDLRRACALDGAVANAHFLLGVVLQRQGRHEEARPCYERAVALDPEYKEALTNLGDVHWRAGRHEAARTALEAALRVDPDFENALFGMALYYERVGAPDSALARYERLERLPWARVRIIRILLDRGSEDEARDRIVRWLLMYPRDPAIRRLYGAVSPPPSP